MGASPGQRALLPLPTVPGPHSPTHPLASLVLQNPATFPGPSTHVAPLLITSSLFAGYMFILPEPLLPSPQRAPRRWWVFLRWRSPQLVTNAGSDDRSANVQANAMTPHLSSQLLLKES